MGAREHLRFHITAYGRLSKTLGAIETLRDKEALSERIYVLDKEIKRLSEVAAELEETILIQTGAGESNP